MSFLAPLFLLGALAAAAPIIFHLIRQTTRERTLFSSTLFLPPARPRLTQRSRLEHWPLLLLRCLALGLLVLGFARPFFRKSAPADGAGPAARRLVVLVDVSASMRRTDLWAEAQARAAAVLRTVAPGDEAAVFTFSRQTTPLVSFEEWQATPPSGRLALALGRLAATEPGWGDDHLGDALIRAAETLTESDAEKKAAGPRQIFLISDLKAGSRLDSLQAFDWPKNIELRTDPVTARYPTNAGLQLVADAPDADRLARPGVRVRVSNAADSAREQFRVGWNRPRPADAGRGAADPARGEGGWPGDFLGPAVDVYVPPGQSRVVAVPLLANAADMRQIALRGDDEDFDNTVYVVPLEQRQWTVLYFGADAADPQHGPLFFLQRALPDNPHLAVRVAARVPNAPVSPAEMQGAKVFFVTDALTPETAAGLRGQMLAGKTVLFAPSSARAASTLAQLLGVPGLALEDVQPADYAMFGHIDFRDPLFAPFADPHYSDFTKIHIWKYRRLKLDALPTARVLAQFDSGDPALAEISVGQGRLLALLTGWNPEDSQLAVSSKFVPLVSSLLELAVGPADEASEYFVGDSIPLGPDAAAGETTILQPDGTTVTLPAGTASFAGARRPGIYRLTIGQRSWRVGVNVPPSESRTAPLAADELQRYGAPEARPPADEARVARREVLLQVAEAEGRQKLWRWLLGATLAVLLIESALAGWTARRSGAAAGTGGTPS